MADLSRSAPAKINLLLRILARRPDGRHEIETVFQKISLADALTFSEAQRDALTVRSPWPLGPPEQNLAWRALQALRGRRRFPPVRITLTKRIPPGAGLGGGSADAAAVLRGLVELFSLRVPEAELMALGLGLGADVPFLLSPHSCAVGRGVGELLEPVEHFQQWPLVLLDPGHPSSTAAAYAAWDAKPCTGSETLLPRLVAGLRAGDLGAVQGAVHNDFEPHLCSAIPRLTEAKKWLQTQFRGPVWPTGSGSALVCLPSETPSAREDNFSPHFSLYRASMLP